MSGTTVLIRGARQLLTLRGPDECRRGAALRELGIMRDGALLIEDGRIVEVGPSRRIENLTEARKAQEIDATGRVVMPGFVDCHTHLVWGIPWLDDYEGRIAGETEQAPRGLESTIRVLRNSSAKRLEARAKHFVNGMVRHGTTTLEAQSGYGLDERNELKILRVQAKLHRAPLDVVSTFLAPRTTPAGSADMSWICATLLPTIRRRGLARFAGLRCGTPQDQLFLQTARNLGFQVKIHAGESLAGEAVRLAVEAGAISMDGLDDAGSAEVEILARSNTIGVLLPGAAFHGNRRCAPARELIDGGAAVALASNFNPGTSPTYSMQVIVALACARLRMTPAEAICAATFNAACAAGVAHEAGSLEAGKAADLLVLNAGDYRELPYHFGVNLVQRTVKRGVTIYREGHVAARQP